MHFFLLRDDSRKDEGGSAAKMLEHKMLLITESAVEFDKLHDELLQDIQPQGPIERYYVEDIAYLRWEVRRYRAAKAGIINAALLEALSGILNQVVPRTRRLMVDNLARGWFDDKKGESRGDDAATDLWPR